MSNLNETSSPPEDEKCYIEFQNPVPTYVQELGVCLENFYNNNGTINPTMCVDNYNAKLESVNMLNKSSLTTSLNNLKNCIYMNNTKPSTLEPTSLEEPPDYSWIGWTVLGIFCIIVIVCFCIFIYRKFMKLRRGLSSSRESSRRSSSINSEMGIVTEDSSRRSSSFESDNRGDEGDSLQLSSFDSRRNSSGSIVYDDNSRRNSSDSVVHDDDPNSSLPSFMLNFDDKGKIITENKPYEIIENYFQK